MTAISLDTLSPLPTQPTPGNSARSIASASRRPGTAAFQARLDAERALTDPAEIEQAAAQRAKEADAVEKAREFVAQALVQPMLKEARESELAWGPFAPGEHEKAFSWLIDERVAKGIVEAKNFPLVDRVVESLIEKPVKLSAVLAERAERAANTQINGESE